MAVTRAEFRQWLSQFATGITIVTSRSGETVRGMTVNAFCSVSLEPPLVLVCINHQAPTHDLIRQSRAFAVNVLTALQRDLSERFGGKMPDEERFVGLDHAPGPTGSPLIADCLAHLDCRVVAAHEAGDHTIFVGEVVWGRVNDDVSTGPLVYYRSHYERLAIPDLAHAGRHR
ncbi:MAG: flavin reductase [Chloroflexi bacterium]|nr:flavin reductase [Chloroflexota bacterium]